MTNATDALLNDLHLIASQGETPDGDGVSVNVQLWAERWVERLATPASPITINHDGIDRKLIDDATPAGSASGEVPFAVVGGVEFDSPQALCAAHAELQSELSDYRMAANAEAREVDRRGERIAALQAEVARLTDGLNTAVSALRIANHRSETLEAALAEARRDAERYLWLVENAVIETDAWRHDGRDAASTKQPLDKAIDAALHQRKENGHAG